MRVGVVDYGAGNLRSVYRAITHIGYDYVEVKSSVDFECLDKLIIPGVGAFQVATNQLRSQQLVSPIVDFSQADMPVLGICLGMQLLFTRSTEFGDENGLGLIEGELLHIRNQYQRINNGRIRVPHIGWSALDIAQNDMIFSTLEGVPPHCYFIHSFMACNVPDENVIATTNYCGLRIPAVVKTRNTIGMQFHPEKSGEKGLVMLRNFLGNEF